MTNPHTSILRYPFFGTGAVTITQSNLMRLRPGKHLDDNLIEFGLKYKTSRIADGSLTNVLAGFG